MAESRRLTSAERPLFFTDAVVAIAITLLIIPLMEAVTSAAEEHLTTAQFFGEHYLQLISFLISFFVISGFWMSHHAALQRVEFFSPALLLLNTFWMLTIVWMPVATALTGAMDVDRLQVAVYVGSMVMTSVFMVAIATHLRRHPELCKDGIPPTIGAVTGSATLGALTLLALVIILIWPGLTYLPLFLLTLTGPIEAVVRRRVAPSSAH